MTLTGADVRRIIHDLVYDTATTREVANKLLNLDCKGEAGDSQFCPLGVYLITKLEAQGFSNFHVSVINENVSVYVVDGGWQPDLSDIPLPRLLQDFVDEVDIHEFPELELPDA